jgi:hypothetical protein
MKQADILAVSLDSPVFVWVAGLFLCQIVTQVRQGLLLLLVLAALKTGSDSLYCSYMPTLTDNRLKGGTFQVKSSSACTPSVLLCSNPVYSWLWYLLLVW